MGQEYKDNESTITLWNLPGGKSLEFGEDFIDNLINQGIDPYDLEAMSNLFQCNVTHTRTTKDTFNGGF